MPKWKRPPRTGIESKNINVGLRIVGKKVPMKNDHQRTGIESKNKNVGLSPAHLLQKNLDANMETTTKDWY
jgi:hypothetical protein